MALGKSGEENRVSLLVLCALFAHSCRGGIQMYSIEGGKGFSVLYNIVTSARDLLLFVDAHGSMYIIFLRHCEDVEG